MRPYTLHQIQDVHRRILHCKRGAEDECCVLVASLLYLSIGDLSKSVVK